MLLVSSQFPSFSHASGDESKLFILLLFLDEIFPRPGVLRAQEDFLYVVMPVNDEYIVDLDDRNNLNIGDILTVVAPGKRILHPETGKVIGSIDNVLGFLQVTRIYSGYSLSRLQVLSFVR